MMPGHERRTERFALVNPDYAAEMTPGLEKHGIRPIPVPRCSTLHPALCGHPDLQFFIHGGVLFTHPGIPTPFLDMLSAFIETRICPARLSPVYPGDCHYNIAVAGKHAFHRADITPGPVAGYLQEKGMILLDVRQGYSRCSTLAVDHSSVITADRGIHEKARLAGLDSLLLTPGDIALPGFRHGFIGGTGGSDGERIFFCGSLMNHPEGRAMEDFIRQRGMEVVELSRSPLHDTGSILIFAGAG